MKPRAAAFATLALLLGVVPAALAQDVLDPSHRSELQLTVGHGLSGATRSGAVIREVRTVDLGPGRHTLAWTDLPEAVVIETLTVALVNAPLGARVISHRAEEQVFAPAVTGALLRGFEAFSGDGRTAAPRRRGAAAAKRPAKAPVRGTIVSLADGAVLRVGSELTVLSPSSLRSAGSLPARSLSIEVEVPPGQQGKVGVEVTAMIGKLERHTPRYTLRLDRSGRGALDGTVTLTNLSGYPLDGARAALTRDLSALPASVTFGAGETWASGSLTALPQPFPIAEPLRFGPTLVAEAALVHAEGVPVSRTLSTSQGVLGMLERTKEPQQLPLTRVFEADLGALRLGVPLPDGQAVVWATPAPTEPGVILGQGHLSHDGGAIAVVRTPEPELRVLARQLVAQKNGECRGMARFAYVVPDPLLAVGAFELVLGGSKQLMSVSLRGKSAATVTVEPYRTLVRLPKGSTGSAGGGGQKIELEVRVRGCS